MDSFYTTCNQIDTDLGLNLYHDHHDYLVMSGVEGFEQTTFPVLLGHDVISSAILESESVRADVSAESLMVLSFILKLLKIKKDLVRDPSLVIFELYMDG